MTVTSSARGGMLPVWQRKQPPVSRRSWTRSSGSGTTCRPSSWTLSFERQRAASEARLEVLQRSKGFKPPESGPGAASPSQSGVPAAPAATYSAQSMQFLASGLLEYAHLATRLMADAKSSCQQLQTIAGLARTTTMPDLIQHYEVLNNNIYHTYIRTT